MGRRHRRPRRFRVAITATSIGIALLVGTSPALAATITYSTTALSATVSGRTVTASTTVKASVAVSASVAGICARNSTGGVVDFPMSAASISTSGITLTRSRTLSPGTYTYWACAKVSGAWHDIGSKKSFTVPSAAPAVAPASPSGQAMPVGNLPGWQQTFTEDFKTNVAMGGFPGPYAPKWASYNGFPDSSGRGLYAQKILSVHDGVLDMYLHSENGRPLGAAPVPLVDGGKWGGQIYGRFSVRFKGDPLPGFGSGWLLWPDSGNWNDGEVDFPEGGLSHAIQGYNHNIGNGAVNSMIVTSTAGWTSWHTATIDWKPTGVSFIIDGVNLGTDTRNIPQKALHWVMQTATSGALPAASTAGHVLIDWVAVYRYTG